jgi:hypothetical protein
MDFSGPIHPFTEPTASLSRRSSTSSRRINPKIAEGRIRVTCLNFFSHILSPCPPRSLW